MDMCLNTWFLAGGSIWGREIVEPFEGGASLKEVDCY